RPEKRIAFRLRAAGFGDKKEPKNCLGKKERYRRSLSIRCIPFRHGFSCSSRNLAFFPNRKAPERHVLVSTGSAPCGTDGKKALHSPRNFRSCRPNDRRD